MTTTSRLRWIVKYAASGPSPTCLDRRIESSVEWAVLKTTAIQWSGWREAEHKVLPEQFWGAKHLEVRKGDVLVTKAGPRQRVGVSAYVDSAQPRIIVSGKMILLRVDETAVDPRYLNWQLATPGPQAYLNACKSGMAEAQLNFANEDLLSMWIKLPPLDKQRRIADFLDFNVARIDALLRARRSQLALLSERHKSLLVGLVSGHMSKDGSVHRAEHADRGIMSRSAPRGWSALPLRRIMQKLNRPTRRGDTVVTAYRDGQVTLRSNRRDDGYTFSDVEAGYQGVEAGDLVFHALDGFAGAVGISDSRGKVSPVYHVCTMREGNDAQFMSLALRAMGLLGYLEVQAGNVRQRSVDFRSWETFGRLILPKPPMESQRRIAREIGDGHDWLEKATVTLNEQCRLLDERRQALIAAAIAEDVDVTAARDLTQAEGIVV